MQNFHPIVGEHAYYAAMTLSFNYVGLLPEHTDPVDYLEAWDLQKSLHSQVVSRERGDTVVFLEHPSVYTAGKRTLPEERPDDGSPVIDVDRGGKITWHGPGQLVGYPLVHLPNTLGVVDYVRRVEEALIRMLAELGVHSGRIPGRSGVWLPRDMVRPDRKIAAIGIRVSHDVTMHGFALNVSPDLGAYDHIVPCGISDAAVTSIMRELGSAPTVFECAQLLEPHLRELLAFEPCTMSPDVGDPVEA